MKAKEYAPAGTLTKTSVMLGCGETPEQVVRTMEKVRAAGVDVITFGQYMRPSKRHMPVSEYITPEAFEKYRILGMEMVCPRFLFFKIVFFIVLLVQLLFALPSFLFSFFHFPAFLVSFNMYWNICVLYNA